MKRLPRRRAAALALLALSLVPASAGARAGVRTVQRFDLAAHETPENLAIADDGTIYVSLAFAGELRRIAPSGAQSTLAIPTRGGITAGLAVDPHHHGDLDVAVRSPDAAAAGIWRVPRTTFSHPRRIAALPTASFPNGITFDRAGNLYVADSTLGRIWRLAHGASRATVWSSSRRLAPTGASFMNFPLPGANGIKLWRHTVYVSNTATRRILAIPILRDGSAGRPRVRFRRIEADDFAFAANGDLYVAVNPFSELIRLPRHGRRAIVATSGDGLQNTSAAGFDPRAGRRRHLYITNSSYFGQRPSLQELTTRSVGLRLG
jgi:sugar lactone lactonase YvrE